MWKHTFGVFVPENASKTREGLFFYVGLIIPHDSLNLKFQDLLYFFFFLAAGTGINNSRPKQGQSREKDITYKSTSFHLESLSVR